jgi:hypothetical protein
MSAATLDDIKGILDEQKGLAERRHDADNLWRGQMTATLTHLGSEIAHVRARVDTHDQQIAHNAQRTDEVRGATSAVGATVARIENETTQQSASLRTLLDDRIVLRGQVKVTSWLLAGFVGLPATILAILKTIEALTTLHR